MTSRQLVWPLAITLAAAAVVAGAQPAAKVPRVAILYANTAAIVKQFNDAFVQELGALGRKEGVNLLIERRYAEGKPERLPRLAEELVQGKPDVIFAPTQPAVDALQKATRTIPIVFSNVSDPVNAGIVASLAKPGGNATGFMQFGTELTGKRLELLKEATPRLTRLGVLGSGDVTSREQLEELRRNAQSLGIKVVPIEANRKEAYKDAFVAARRARVEALFVLSNIPNFANRHVIGELVVKYRLPTVHDQSVFVEAGGLMSYGPDTAVQFRRAAGYVDRILKGAKPADLPVQRPTEVELAINLKTARAIGLAIPPSLLLRASHVIE